MTKGYQEIVADPADKYRSNSVQFPNQLKHIVRFGKDTSGFMWEIKIPKQLQEHFWISQLRDAVHANPPKPGQAYAYKRAFEILLAVFEENANPNMRQFGSVFLKKAKSLVKGNPKKPSDTARAIFVLLGQETRDENLKLQIKEFAGVGIKRGGRLKWGTWPKLSKTDQPRKSLEQKVEIETDDDITNEMYVKSFSQFIYCYLKKWSDLRNTLKTDHPDLYSRIVSLVDKHGVDKIERIAVLQSVASAEKLMSKDTADWQIYTNIWELNFAIIQQLDDNYLALNGFAASSASKKFEEQIAPKCDLNDIVQSYLSTAYNGGKSARGAAWPWKRMKPSNVMPSLSFSVLDFLRPSKEEKLCVYWLLSMLRIQESNVEKLLNEKVFDSLLENKSCHIVHSYKGRNKDAEPIPLIKNSPLGRALSIYRKARNPENSPFPIEQFFGDYFVGPIPVAAFKLQGTRNFGFMLFDIDKSKVGFDNISDECFKLIKTVFKKYYRAPEGKGLKLATSFFAQSKLYNDLSNSETKITKKSDLSIPVAVPDRFEEEIKAKRQFHTLDTRESVYMSRSKSKAQLKVGEQLAVAMSNEMHATVNDLLEAKERKTSVLSFTEIQKVIGLSDSETEASPEAILAAAQAQDYILQRNGLITKNGQTYIFDCGLVARFMIEARAHIESNNGKGLEDVFLSQGRTRGLNIWAEYILLDHLIERVLSPTSIQSALTDYAYLEGKVPFIPLTEGGVL